MSQEPVGNSLVNWIGRQQYEGQLDGSTFFFRAFLFLGPSGIVRSPAVSALFTAVLSG